MVLCVTISDLYTLISIALSEIFLTYVNASTILLFLHKTYANIVQKTLCKHLIFIKRYAIISTKVSRFI